MTSLIDRLRAWPASMGRGDPLEAGFVSALMGEAADEINRYACQVEDLEAECDRLAAQYRAAIEHRPWWWRLIGLNHMRTHR